MRCRSFCNSLSNLSVFIEGDKKVGIIWRTGAGKSPTLQVLFGRVNPESGNAYRLSLSYDLGPARFM